jgi:Protein of unknown function (DUF3551)
MTQEITVKLLQTVLVASVTALSALTLSGFANAAPLAQPGQHYCLSFNGGGGDCSFTSYKQCMETALGMAAECFGEIPQDDGSDRTSVPHW